MSRRSGLRSRALLIRFLFACRLTTLLVSSTPASRSSSCHHNPWTHPISGPKFQVAHLASVRQRAFDVSMPTSTRLAMTRLAMVLVARSSVLAP
eukprot:scaffold41175_cov33-Tisochrysis_lutea.AAC.4